MADGLQYEERVMRLLQDFRCDLLNCEGWDHEDKIDFIVTRVNGRTLRWSAAIQLTQQGGNAHKLERFIRSCDLNGRYAHVYAVAHVTMSPWHCARVLRRFLEREEERGRLTQGIHGVFIGGNEKPWQRFDVYRRLVKLQRRADPDHSAHRRVTGAIVEVRARSFVVEHDGVRYLTRLGDFADGRLVVRFRDDGTGRDLLVGRRVSFVPHQETHTRTKEVLRFALSAVLAD